MAAIPNIHVNLENAVWAALDNDFTRAEIADIVEQAIDTWEPPTQEVFDETR